MNDFNEVWRNITFLGPDPQTRIKTHAPVQLLSKFYVMLVW